MARILIVVAVVALLMVGRMVYERRRAGIADRRGLDQPALPTHLRGPGRTWVVFATEFCATCGPVVDRLRRMHPADTVHKILVEEQPDLAHAYAVQAAPTLLETDATGSVVHSVAGAAHVLRYVESLASA